MDGVMLGWCNGSHAGLRSQCPKGVRVRLPPPAPPGSNPTPGSRRFMKALLVTRCGCTKLVDVPEDKAGKELFVPL